MTDATFSELDLNFPSCQFVRGEALGIPADGNFIALDNTTGKRLLVLARAANQSEYRVAA